MMRVPVSVVVTACMCGGVTGLSVSGMPACGQLVKMKILQQATRGVAVSTNAIRTPDDMISAVVGPEADGSAIVEVKTPGKKRVMAMSLKPTFQRQLKVCFYAEGGVVARRKKLCCEELASVADAVCERGCVACVVWWWRGTWSSGGADQHE